MRGAQEQGGGAEWAGQREGEGAQFLWGVGGWSHPAGMSLHHPQGLVLTQAPSV